MRCFDGLEYEPRARKCLSARADLLSVSRVHLAWKLVKSLIQGVVVTTYIPNSELAYAKWRKGYLAEPC